MERNREIVDREALPGHPFGRGRRPGTGAPGGGRLMDLAQRLAAFEHADLYVVITEAFCAGRTALGGVGSGSGRRGGNRPTPGKGPGRTAASMSWRVEFRRRTEAAGSLLIIDDRVDIALAARRRRGPPGPDRPARGRGPAHRPGPHHRRLQPFSGRGPGGPGGRGRDTSISAPSSPPPPSPRPFPWELRPSPA